MAWNLAAVGEALEDAEQALLAEIRAVLAKAEYGTTASSLHGGSVSADPAHSPADPPAAPAE
jgi:hypothetical protein